MLYASVKVCFVLLEPSDDLDDLNFFNQKKKKKKTKKVFENEIEEGLKVCHGSSSNIFLPFLFSCRRQTLLHVCATYSTSTFFFSPNYIHVLIAFYVLAKFYFSSIQIRIWKLKASQQKLWRKTTWIWCFPPKKRSLRKWNLMREAHWRKTTVRISPLIFKDNKWKQRNSGTWVMYFFDVFPALDDDEGKSSDGISFSSSTGPAWAGSERDYTYDEVRHLWGGARAKTYF